MPATFDITIDGDNATYTLTGTAAKQPVLDTAEDAARYLYPIRYQLYEEGEEQTPIPFDDLTLIQRKTIIAREFVYCMREFAKTYHANAATDAAREAAIAEAGEKYDIE